MTEEMFFKIFLCCLYWQWKRGDYAHMWTTMDKVTRITGPTGLRILTEKQINALRTSRHFAGIMKVKCKVMMANSLNSDAEGILTTTTPLVARVGLGKTIDWRRVMRDTPLFLTDSGSRLALSFEQIVAPHISREQYVAECKRQDILKAVRGDSAAAGVATNYRKKLAKEFA